MLHVNHVEVAAGWSAPEPRMVPTTAAMAASPDNNIVGAGAGEGAAPAPLGQAATRAPSFVVHLQAAQARHGRVHGGGTTSYSDGLDYARLAAGAEKSGSAAGACGGRVGAVSTADAPVEAKMGRPGRNIADSTRSACIVGLEAIVAVAPAADGLRGVHVTADTDADADAGAGAGDKPPDSPEALSNGGMRAYAGGLGGFFARRLVADSPLHQADAAIDAGMLGPENASAHAEALAIDDPTLTSGPAAAGAAPDAVDIVAAGGARVTGGLRGSDHMAWPFVRAQTQIVGDAMDAHDGRPAQVPRDDAREVRLSQPIDDRPTKLASIRSWELGELGWQETEGPYLYRLERDAPMSMLHVTQVERATQLGLEQLGQANGLRQSEQPDDIVREQCPLPAAAAEPKAVGENGLGVQADVQLQAGLAAYRAGMAGATPHSRPAGLGSGAPGAGSAAGDVGVDADVMATAAGQTDDAPSSSRLQVPTMRERAVGGAQARCGPEGVENDFGAEGSGAGSRMLVAAEGALLVQAGVVPVADAAPTQVPASAAVDNAAAGRIPVSQLPEPMAAHVAGGVRRIALRVAPPGSGAVDIGVRLERTAVHLTLRGDAAPLMRQLHDDLPKLHAALAEHGLELGQADFGRTGLGQGRDDAHRSMGEGGEGGEGDGARAHDGHAAEPRRHAMTPAPPIHVEATRIIHVVM